PTACRHSVSGQGGKVSVSLSALRTGLVLVTVTDQGPRPDPHTGRPRTPRPAPADPLTPGGLGLRLVAALTTDWGHWRAEDGGHAVWAVFEPP
ncbi:ATP-binding protein, partial [Thermobifida halotolerans]|uniref:ATP-binding protein n=1 Tax=Thermobifida halotolerans TaxID=483545 RepID=UPI0018FEC89C